MAEAAAASSSAAAPVPDEGAIMRQFESLRGGVEDLWSKMNELEMEKHEHGLVLDALKPLDGQRKCFRLIGGVLVERTVADVAPAVERNREGIDGVLAKLTEQLEVRKKELQDFMTKYKIRVKGGAQPQAAAESSGGAQGSQGVLA